MSWLKRWFKPVIVNRVYQVMGVKAPFTEEGVAVTLLGMSTSDSWALLKHKFTRDLINHLDGLPNGKTKPGDVAMELGIAKGIAQCINRMSQAEVPPETQEEREARENREDKS